jgi:hypothetical protein
MAGFGAMEERSPSRRQADDHQLGIAHYFARDGGRIKKGFISRILATLLVSDLLGTP